ncbi:hypothetical protein DENIS_0905 [Desulfonema ishimotonii]|uniref:Uncharacterized protein n=1 Tax=Desulfonema ishimotonii TaxID=45657 RepID=A0A401FSN4_9BACT|nr:hypothetical protein DENIS_0905 [Desulfonema ishimotonii]
MKKIIILYLLLIIIGGILISYSVSKERAENIVRNYEEPISPLKGQLIIFIGDKFSPCWLFRGEHKHALTGATFDVYVSMSGRVFKIPPKKQKYR